MGVGGPWDLTSLDWVRDMGVKRGRGKGIRRPNSHQTLPGGTLVIQPGSGN